MAVDCLREGTFLDNRYRIKKVLGVGGFGITYLTEDQSLAQYVVVKEYFPLEITARVHEGDGQALILPREKNDRKHFLKGKRDFLEEGRRMSKLFDVPEVVKVLDWFEENETAYLVMEYIKGISLDIYLQNQDIPLSFGQAWKMLEPVAEAMEKIHKKGILHRDLNPSNLMLQEDGTLRIIDFGAARPYLETEKTMTVLIKKGYAPPEQYMGKGRQGPWTDVYALCATIYEMITGVRPEPSVDRLQKDELYLPSAYGAEILPEEEKILCRGLELDFRKRFAAIRELRQALDSAMGEKREKNTKKKTGSRRWKLGIGVGMIFCVLCVAVGFWGYARGKEETVVYAGNYGRRTEKYKEYLEFVKNRAVSSSQGKVNELYPYQGISTIYTLEPKDVKEWGEPCNRLRFNSTQEEYLKYMETKGYTMKKTREEEKDTVEVEKYGAILTDFEKEEEYEIKDGEEIWIRSDSVNQDLFQIGFNVTENNKDEVKEMMTETAKFLSGKVPVEEKTVRADFDKLDDWPPEEGWIGTEYNYWLCTTDTENGGRAWIFGVNESDFNFADYFWE